MSSQYIILCSKNFIIENTAKITFFLPCRFSSIRILRFISAHTKELYKNLLGFRIPVLMKTLVLIEI